MPPEAGDHAHESPPVMTVPLLVLAIGAIGVGIVVEPFTHWFSEFLSRTPSLRQAAEITGAEEISHGFNWGIAGLSTLLSLGGLGVAFMAFGKGGPEAVAAWFEPVHRLSRRRLYVDEIYQGVIVRPAEVVAFLARVFDEFLDSLSRWVAAIPRFLALLLQPIQNGLVQFYAISMAMGLAVFLVFVVFLITR